MPGAIQMLAQERNLEQLLLGQEAERNGKAAQQRRRVHVAQVIRRQHVAAVGVEPLGAFHGDLHAADPQQHASPRTGDFVRQPAV